MKKQQQQPMQPVQHMPSITVNTFSEEFKSWYRKRYRRERPAYLQSSEKQELVKQFSLSVK